MEKVRYHHNRFTVFFSGTTRVSQCQKRTSGLYYYYYLLCISCTQSTKYKKYTHKTYNRHQEVQIKSTAWVRSAWERHDIKKYPSLAKSSSKMVQGKINRGRHTDHLDGRHSIRTKLCPSPSSPMFFTGRMPFLPPNQQCQSTEGN